MAAESLQRIAEELRMQRYESTGNVYHPLPFPEFRQLKTSTNPESAYAKWHMISRTMRSLPTCVGLRVLDVGANAGFYSFNFAQRGANVEAYEPHQHYADLGRRIADATKLPVQWYNKPLEPEDIVEDYDVALMLSVFQWMSQGNECLEAATEILRKVASASRYLFFELGCNRGKSAIHTSVRPIVWIWELLRQHTSPKRVAFLGSTSAWGRSPRYLFVCSEDRVELTLWQRLVTRALRGRWIH